MSRYWRLRPVVGADEITGRRARELYEAAAADPDSGLVGDLESGFEYAPTHEGVRLVSVRVEPAPPGADSGEPGAADEEPR